MSEFSVAMKSDGKIGLKDKERSGLFLECNRVLKEVNPKWFLMENVASMRNDDRDLISTMIGVEPIKINSSLVSCALRNRYYWTNIHNSLFIKNKEISLQSILENGYTNKNKANCLMVSDSRPCKTPVKMFHRYYNTGFTTLIFKSKEHFEKCKDYYDKYYKGMNAKDIPVDETTVFDGVRYLTRQEREICQTVPVGYTNCLTENEAANVLGDGWTIDIICHLFTGIKEELEKENYKKEDI